MKPENHEGEFEDLREQLAPLQALQGAIAPPAGLAERTIAYVRQESARPKVLAAGFGSSGSNGTWHSRLNIAVAASLLFMVAALGFGGLTRLQHSHAQTACQNNLRQLYADLGTYASLHDGQFPELGKGAQPAKAFVDILMREGFLSSRSAVVCPEVSRDAAPIASPVDYAYSLGTVGDDGKVHGPTNQDDGNTTPLLADRPLKSWVPKEIQANHLGGANVLFVSGSVRFCTNPNVGWQGDHIYLNLDKRVAAGLNFRDSVLGGPEDHP